MFLAESYIYHFQTLMNTKTDKIPNAKTEATFVAPFIINITASKVFFEVFIDSLNHTSLIIVMGI